MGEDVGCDEYIDPRHGMLREIKAAGGRASGLDWIWFRRPFHPDRMYGVNESL
jgi:hypothetical protein